MHSDWLCKSTEGRSFLSEALSHINQARRYLKSDLHALELVRILADALNSVQNEWSLSALSDAEEMGEVKTFKEMILCAMDEEYTIRLLNDGTVSRLINCEPVVLNHRVLLNANHRPGQNISDKLRKKAGEKHKKCRNKYEKITKNESDGDIDGFFLDLAELLYIVRSNVMHGHKTAYGPDMEQIERDEAVCKLVAPVQLLILDSLLNRPSCRMAAISSSNQLEKVEHLVPDLSADWRKCEILGRIDSSGDTSEFIWDPKATCFDALYCESVDFEWGAIDECIGEGYERILVPATTSNGLLIVNIYQKDKRGRII